MTAWNGTADEFWDALKAHVEQRETEGDAAIIADVLTAARLSAAASERLRRFEQREGLVRTALESIVRGLPVTAEMRSMVAAALAMDVGP